MLGVGRRGEFPPPAAGCFAREHSQQLRLFPCTASPAAAAVRVLAAQPLPWDHCLSSSSKFSMLAGPTIIVDVVNLNWSHPNSSSQTIIKGYIYLLWGFFTCTHFPVAFAVYSDSHLWTINLPQIYATKGESVTMPRADAITHNLNIYSWVSKPNGLGDPFPYQNSVYSKLGGFFFK